MTDVAWGSEASFVRHDCATPYPGAPELCAAVRSPANTQDALRFKTRLYLEAGVPEVWIVFEKGAFGYFGPEGERAVSAYGRPAPPAEPQTRPAPRGAATRAAGQARRVRRYR